MTGDLFARFIDGTGPLWDRYIHHAWFEAIHRGDLAMDRFKFFIVHDMPYQHDFLNALLLAALRSSEPDTWLKLRASDLKEVAFEESILAEMGAEWTFDRWAAGPAREGYMNHITRVALEGNITYICAALLPCAAGFTGAMAAPADKTHLPPLYRRWLEFYEQPEYAEFSTELVRLFEESARRLGKDELAVAQMVFVRSLRHQIAVFDAAWETGDEW